MKIIFLKGDTWLCECNENGKLGKLICRLTYYKIHL